jgi:hypothetical protein
MKLRKTGFYTTAFILALSLAWSRTTARLPVRARSTNTIANGKLRDAS